MLAATILFWSVALDAIAYRCPGVGRVIKAQPRPLISVIRRDPEETDEPVRPEAAL